MLDSYWAIRFRPESNSYLPLAKGRGGNRGFTHVEPSQKLPPRLFVAERYARVALTHYLKGPLTVDVVDMFSGHEFEPTYDQEWIYTDVGRKSSDYEIIRVRVVRLDNYGKVML